MPSIGIPRARASIGGDAFLAVDECFVLFCSEEPSALFLRDLPALRSFQRSMGRGLRLKVRSPFRFVVSAHFRG